MNNLVLYFKPTCPFCQKVLTYLEQNEIEVKKHDILRDEEALETLIRVGGKQQVPCLFIDGKPLYESDDIIAYFEQNF